MKTEYVVAKHIWEPPDHWFAELRSNTYGVDDTVTMHFTSDQSAWLPLGSVIKIEYAPREAKNPHPPGDEPNE